MSHFTKDPAAVLDYRVDWSRWLSDGEVITASTWTVTDGVTVDSNSHDGASATVWLSGGEPRKRYTATNRVTTDQGRTDERSIFLTVQDR